MIFRQLLDQTTGTFTYLLGDDATRECCLIDPVFEQHPRDLALIRELNLKLIYTIETHVHADHVTGAWLMKERLGSQIAVSRVARVAGADRVLDDGDVLQMSALELQAIATPGHTSGCMSFFDSVAGRVFTGDALLIRGAGRTDFQEGSPSQLFRSVRERLFPLGDKIHVYPGHDYSGRTMTTIAEEKKHNPRLKLDVRLEDFEGYMNNLGLPHPRLLEIALAANQKAGRPEHDVDQTKVNWAPVTRSYAGVCQIEAEWVHQHRDRVLIIDVREHREVGVSDLGLIDGAQVVPLSELRERASSLPQMLPIVTSCPAGARSAMAATILEQAGFKQVANLVGGVLGWQALGLPTTRSELDA